MELNRNFDQEISLRDLFFDILYHWRSILIVALAFALMLGGMQYAKARRANRLEVTEEEQARYEASLGDYNTALENSRRVVRGYTDLIADRSAYVRDSVWINLDASDVWRARRVYVVRAEGTDTLQDAADGVLAAYAEGLKADLDPEKAEALLGTSEADFVDEMVKAESDYEANSLTLTVYGADEAAARAAMEYFAGRLEGECAELAEVVAPHELVRVRDEVIHGADSSLQAAQEYVSQKQAEYQTALNKGQDALDALTAKGAPASPDRRVGGVKKRAVLGFFLGGALMVGAYLALYLLNGRMHRAEDVALRYSVPLYGEFVSSRARRKDRGLDGLIERWEFRGEITDDTAVADNICALLRQRHAGERVLLLGTVPEARMQALKGLLQDRLGQSLRLSAQGGFTRNSGAVAQAGGADAVILVEAKHASRMREVAAMADQLKLCEARVDGCITI